MFTCPRRVVELADIVAILAEPMRENVQREIHPPLFFVFDLSIVSTTKTVEFSELLLQSGVGFVRRPVGGGWRW